jgi:hypothetical protein
MAFPFRDFVNASTHKPEAQAKVSALPFAGASAS